VTSQFENHLRAVVGLPLGSTSAIGCSAMLNLIGDVPTPPKSSPSATRTCTCTASRRAQAANSDMSRFAPRHPSNLRRGSASFRRIFIALNSALMPCCGTPPRATMMAARVAASPPRMLRCKVLCPRNDNRRHVSSPRVGIPWRTSQEEAEGNRPKIKNYEDAVRRAGGERS